MCRFQGLKPGITAVFAIVLFCAEFTRGARHVIELKDQSHRLGDPLPTSSLGCLRKLKLSYHDGYIVVNMASVNPVRCEHHGFLCGYKGHSGVLSMLFPSWRSCVRRTLNALSTSAIQTVSLMIQLPKAPKTLQLTAFRS